jgi:phytoene synthase
MQLTNIARDVGEDARRGRLYLPTSWLLQAGIDPSLWLASPAFSPELGTVVRRVLDAADALYERAESGIGRLPARARAAIWGARLIYADIGCVIARRRYDSVTRRAVTSPARKARLLVGAVRASFGPAGPAHHAVLPEAGFLVSLAARRPTLATATRGVPLTDPVVPRFISQETS